MNAKHFTLTALHAATRSIVPILAVALVLGYAPLTVGAATFTIADGDVTGLKNAITAANGNLEDDTISLAAGGTYTLTTVDNTNFDGSGLPVIRSDGGHTLTLTGHGATIQRSTASGTPIFRIAVIALGANAAFNNLSIANGSISSSGTFRLGAGIYIEGALTLSNCAIRNNNGHYGGGVSNAGTLTMTNCSIINNTALFGGGIDNEDATLVLRDCTLTGNSAGSAGGGLFHKNGPATVTGCIFNANRASFVGAGIENHGAAVPTTMEVTGCTFTANDAFDGHGGGIRNSGATMTVSGSTFSGNKAKHGAGGIENDGAVPATLTVVSSTFTSNSVGTSDTQRSGGAIRSGTSIVGGQATLTVRGSTFVSNTASGSGGGIYSFRTSQEAIVTATVTDSTFDHNSAQFQGGALANYSAAATVTGSTFTRNMATGAPNYPSSGQGGALSNQAFGGTNPVNGTLTVQNCTLHENIAIAGGGIANTCIGGSATVTAQSCTFSQNDAFDGGGAIFNQAWNSGSTSTVTLGNNIFKFGKVAGTAANLFIDPRAGTARINSQGYNLSDDNGGGFLNVLGDQINTDPGIAIDPQDNGGPTKTMRLALNSPAVDKGNAFGLTTDQRGQARPSDDPSIAPAPFGDNSDIGAFELSQTPQSGPTFVVNTAVDHTGACTLDDCTLREAVSAANATPGEQNIVFASNVLGTLGLTQGELVVTDSVTINGPGARALAVTTNATSRVFSFTAGSSVINDLTIRDSRVLSLSGSAAGGGISNQATLVLRNCRLSNNVATGGSAFRMGNGGTGRGGAIDNSGTLTLTRCTFNGNSAFGGRGADRSPRSGPGTGGAALGGAVSSAAGATLTINNSTFNGNRAIGGAGGNAPAEPGVITFGGNGGGGSGGAVFNQGALTVTNSTLSGNSGTGGAGGQATNPGVTGSGLGGVASSGGASTVRSTIIAGNTVNNSSASDVAGTFISEGFNLIGTVGQSSGFTLATDQTGTNATPLDPKLAALTSNGGSTNTMALLSGSPAIDKGNSFGAVIDQRGRARPLDRAAVDNAPGGDGSDIGAFEFGATLLTLPAVSINDITVSEGDAGNRNAYFTVTLSEPAGSTVTVSYRSTNSTTRSAIAGRDYIAKSGTLSFTAGQVRQILSVAVLGDVLNEYNETFFVKLSNPANATIQDAQGRGVITDNDARPNLSITDVTVAEGNSGALDTIFKVRLSAASGRSVSVNYATANGTATAGSDYAVKSGTLNFAPGVTTRSVTIKRNGDTTVEPNETFLVNLSSAVNATILDSQSTGTITNDDPAVSSSPSSSSPLVLHAMEGRATG